MSDVSNYQPVLGNFDNAGNLLQMWGPNGKVAFDPTSVAPVLAAANQLFFSPLSSFIAPTKGAATLAFARNFESSQLLSTGLYSDAAHLTAAYTWDENLRRARYKSSVAVTNLVTGASVTCHRDLTQAEWVKTTMTAAKTQTGIDGAANSCSLLTATAGNATALFSITTAAAARTFSAFVKRSAGRGRVWITRDNGATWKDVTASIDMAGFTRVSIANHSVLNPTVGFMLETSGDAIAVDSVTDTNTPYVLGLPLLTRGADVQGSTLTYSALANPTVPGRRYMVTAKMKPGQGDAARIFVGVSGVDSTSLQYLLPSRGFNIQSFSGSVVQYNVSNTTPPFPVAPDTDHTVSMIFGVGQMSVVVDGNHNFTSDTQKLDPGAMSQLVLNGDGQFADLELRELRGNNVVLLGDSITADAKYPQLFRDARNSVDWCFHGRGVSGNRITDVTARIATDVTPYFHARGRRNLVLLWIGTNTLADNVLAAAALAQLATCVAAIKAGGAWEVRVINMLNRTTGLSNGATIASIEVQRVIFNAGLSAVPGVDAVIDVASVPEVANSTDTNWFVDGIHINAAGYAAVFPTISTAMGT